MTTVWRFVKERHLKDAFSGEGPRLFGGRWNHKGYSVVYTSGSLALAVLEQFVHLSKSEAFLRFVYMRIDIPDSVRVEIIGDLPKNWRDEPPPNATKAIGSDWLKSSRSTILCVPSVIIPTEFNFVLNPAHPDFKKMTFSDHEVFTFDPRMWKS